MAEPGAGRACRGRLGSQNRDERGRKRSRQAIASSARPATTGSSAKTEGDEINGGSGDGRLRRRRRKRGTSSTAASAATPWTAGPARTASYTFRHALRPRQRRARSHHEFDGRGRHRPQRHTAIEGGGRGTPSPSSATTPSSRPVKVRVVQMGRTPGSRRTRSSDGVEMRHSAGGHGGDVSRRATSSCENEVGSWSPSPPRRPATPGRHGSAVARRLPRPADLRAGLVRLDFRRRRGRSLSTAPASPIRGVDDEREMTGGAIYSHLHLDAGATNPARRRRPRVRRHRRPARRQCRQGRSADLLERGEGRRHLRPDRSGRGPHRRDRAESSP